MEALTLMMEEIKTVHDLLRSSKHKLHLGEGTVFGTVKQAPSNLPTPPAIQTIEEGQFVAKPKVETKNAQQEADVQAVVKAGLFQKDYVRYPLIFIFSFGFFYLFLNFGALTEILTARLQKPAVEPQTQGKVLGVATPDYNFWIQSYFYQVNAADEISPNFDYDLDGLTNYQEFLLGTNPTRKDTDDDGYADGREILNGYDPLYEGKLTPKQLEIIKDWDLSDINNRISYNARMALASNRGSINPLFDVTVGPQLAALVPAINYNLAGAGELVIPKLNVKVPITWSKSPDDFTKDLERGVVHYPGTSLPGQVGVAYISGHSSNYIWSKSNYSHVFSRLNELVAGDEFFVTVLTAGGGKTTFRYVVSTKSEFKPDDEAQFFSVGNESIVNLSTCWPVGSTARRYVVSGKLTGV